MKRFLVWFAQVTGLVCVIMFSVFPVSCRVTPEGIQIIGADYTCPVIDDFRVVSDTELEVVFSDSVKVNGLVISEKLLGNGNTEFVSETNLNPQLEDAAGLTGRLSADYSVEEKGCLVRISMESTQVGKEYILYGETEDKTGSTLTFALPFIGYNSRVPQLYFTEIRTQLKSQNNGEKAAGVYKSEMIQFFVAKSGNLAGLAIKSGYDGEARDFNFPPLEVEAGQIIIVHPRLRGAGAVSELGDDLTLSTAPYSSDSCRDLWGNEDKAHYGDKTDVILLVNTCTGKVIDGVMYAEDGLEEWKKPLQQEYALLAASQGIFPAANISSAAKGQKLTASLSLYRTGLLEISDSLSRNEEIPEQLIFNADNWNISPASEGFVGILK